MSEERKNHLLEILKLTLFTYVCIIFLSVLAFGNKVKFDHPRLIGFSAVLGFIFYAQNNRKNNANQKEKKTYIGTVTELLHGDRAAAIRLFNYNKEKFGGKSDEWLWQKVIRDIERDRR